jgi:hypothetical protein
MLRGFHLTTGITDMKKKRFDIIKILKSFDGIDGCWEWPGFKNEDGYGRGRYLGKKGSAHRFSWQINFGEIPTGMCVCHHCDNPACINPKHLFLGTHIDNMRDMRKKGRGADFSGERNPRAKLTAQDVIEMRKKYVRVKYSTCMLAREYGVTQRAAWLAITGNGWKNL